MDSRNNDIKYYSSFLHMFSLCYLIWIPVVLVTVFLNVKIEDFIGILLTGAVIMGALALAWVLLYPISINENGIKIRSSSGKVTLFNWDEIEKIKPANFLYFKYFKLFNVKSYNPVTMPFTVQKKQQFIEDIKKYSPEGHPLKVYIETGDIIEVKKPINTENVVDNDNANTRPVDDNANIRPVDDNANTRPVNEKLIEEKLKIQSILKSGANWFYWIAALSLINTAIFISGGDWSFVVGLSITQVIDGVTLGISQEISTDFLSILRVISVAVDIIIAGVFIVFGYFANKRHNWSFIIGMILYALDAMIALAFKDFFSAGFHALALYGIYKGLKANKKLAEVEQNLSFN